MVVKGMVRAHSHNGFYLSDRGELDFEVNEISGELKFFKIKGVKKKRGKDGRRGGGEEELLEMKLQTESKISEYFQNVFMSYIINYLSNSTFLYSFSISCCSAFSCCMTIQKKWNFWKIPKSYTQTDIVF